MYQQDDPQPQNWDAEAVETFGREVTPPQVEPYPENYNWEDLERVSDQFRW